ncbi:WecB/TagA/CpsF family glycosyltransferase [Pilimelia columellifera]|uniref:WecB/TagA/CpsF family glycosyltransferase n=1 Tax=Pilimelia columellifera subsp. columellifera TaxID=706583 RepID=A0ABN3NKX3_9ACTN
MSEQVTSRQVSVGDVPLHRYTEDQVVAAVREALGRDEGGWIVTPNVDILRQARRHPAARQHLDDATVVVADGMPLVWASRIAGTPLPERVCGANLIWSLTAALATDGRSVYLLGGSPDADGPSGAVRAAERLRAAHPGLRIAGAHSPGYGFDQRPDELSATLDAVVGARPDLVLVGLGFPRQEAIIAMLRPRLPGTWFLGCGAAINFVAGDRSRAPRWMQRAGLEWAHRLTSEPGRLASRYLRHDLPYVCRLLIDAGRRRRQRPGHDDGAARRAT